MLDNAAYLQFMWKADVVESWIADKENHVRSEDLGRELSSVQTHAGKITISLLILSLAIANIYCFCFKKRSACV